MIILLGKILSQISKFITYNFCFLCTFRTQLRRVFCHYIIRNFFSLVFNHILLMSFWALNTITFIIYISTNILFKTMYVLSKAIGAFSAMPLTSFWALTRSTFNVHISTNNLFNSIYYHLSQNSSFPPSFLSFNVWFLFY